MRAMLSAGALLGLAACAPPPAGPGMLLLSNPDSTPVKIEAAAVTSGHCAGHAPGPSAAAFSLPGDGTRFIAAPAGADVCWRRTVTDPETGKPKWSDWNRAFTASGQVIDSNL